MTDANSSDLCPELGKLYGEWLHLCAQADLTARATVTFRSPHDQNAAKARGLSNAAAGESPHNCVDAGGRAASRAFDFGIFEEYGVYITDGTDDRYAQAAQIAKHLGLAWGGDWKHPDYDHLELADWRNNPSPAIFPQGLT